MKRLQVSGARQTMQLQRNVALTVSLSAFVLTEKHSVDRKDNNGNYEPGNVRWATQSEQTKNQRRCMAIQSFTDEEMISELKRRNLVR